MRINVLHASASAVSLAVVAVAAVLAVAALSEPAHADHHPPSNGCVRGLAGPKLTFHHSWARVVSSWCYQGGNVTWFHSARDGHQDQGDLRAHLAIGISTYPQISTCDSYNGFRRHNCYTRFDAYTAFVRDTALGPVYKITKYCVESRLYGNGNWKNAILKVPCSRAG